MNCPNCGSAGDFTYVEEIICWRRVREPGEDPVIIEGYYETDGDGDNARFFCCACHHEFPVPADVEIDFI